MTTSAPSEVRARTRAPAPLIAFAFVTLVCGSNALTPLLPLYAERLGLTSVDRAVVFCGYFLGLITVLLLAARTRLVEAARAVLLVALLVAVAGDLALILGARTPLLLAGGRVLIGISVALGTGSAAALMVAARGEAGRAFIAAGSLVGACVGLSVAVTVVTWLPAPMTTIYLLHIVVALATLIALLVTARRSSPPIAADRGDEPVIRRPAPAASSRGARRTAIAAFAGGGIGWSFGALTTGALPAVLRSEHLVGSTPLAVAVGGIALLTSCAGIAAGLGSPGSRSWPLLVAAGWVLVAAGLWLHWLPLVALACAVGGVGQAGAYRSGLRALTVGLDPVGQGQVTSAYSAVAYGSCAVSLLISGWLELWLGAVAGTAALAGAVLVVAAVTTVLPPALRPVRVSADKPVDTRETAGQSACVGRADPLN